VVTEPIKPADNTGAVRVDSQEWRATAGERIGAGAQVEVVAVKGAMLVVKQVSRKV